MGATIQQLAAFAPDASGRQVGSIDASWCQGPGVYGGLLAAALGDAIERSCPGRPLRALSLHLCAPATPGTLAIQVTPARAGARVSFFEARLLGPDGLPAVIATATAGRARAEDADFDDVGPPALPPPERLPQLEAGPDQPGVPAFTQHFQFRFARGVPFTGASRASSAGWVRPRLPQPLGTPLALALLDVWPLALLPRLPAPRPASSAVIHMQLYPPLPDPPEDAWYAVQVDSDLMRAGYADQRTSLWGPDGRLLGRCQQLVALVR